MKPNERGNVCFRVTRRCNLRCGFCQAPPNGKELPLAALKHVLAQLKTMGIQRVKLTGGEPYVREDIDDVIAHCSRLDLDVTLCSNGTLLDDQRIRVLHQANGKIKVGLHGTPELHDTLVGAHVAHQVHSNIVRCLQVGVKLSIHTLLTRMSDRDKVKSGVWNAFGIG